MFGKVSRLVVVFFLGFSCSVFSFDGEWGIIFLKDKVVFSDHTVNECLVNNTECISLLLNKELDVSKRINIMVFEKNESSMKTIDALVRELTKKGVVEVLISFQEKSKVGNRPSHIESLSDSAYSKVLSDIESSGLLKKK